MIKRYPFKKDDYFNGHFSPWINYIQSAPKTFAVNIKQSFADSLVMTSDQQKVMREKWGPADFSFDGEFRNFAWAFKYKEWSLLFICSKKGSALEVSHPHIRNVFDSNIDKSLLKSLSDGITEFRVSLFSWLDASPSISTSSLIIRTKDKFEKLELLQNGKLISDADIVYNDILEAKEAGFQVITL